MVKLHRWGAIYVLLCVRRLLEVVDCIFVVRTCCSVPLI